MGHRVFDPKIRRVIENSGVGVLDSRVPACHLHEILNNPFAGGYAEG